MLITKYLVVSSTGGTKLTTNPPSLESNEIVIHLKLNIPNTLFKRPQLSATINIDENRVQQQEVTAELLSELEAMASQQLGISLTIVPPTQQTEQTNQ